MFRLREIDRRRLRTHHARRRTAEKHRHADPPADSRQAAILGKVKIQPVRDLLPTFELRMPDDINREGSSIAIHGCQSSAGQLQVKPFVLA